MSQAAPRWRQVATLAELPPDQPAARTVGARQLVLVNHAGRIHALDATCPHKHGNLAEGKIVLGELACPLHGFRYSLDSGRAAVPSQVPGVRCYPVSIDGDNVLVDLRSRRPAPTPPA